MYNPRVIMHAAISPSPSTQSLLRRHPATCYFLITFFLSWLGAFLVAAPHLLRREPLSTLTGILMFPAMLVGPFFTGIFLTALFDGRSGIRNLFSRLGRWRVPLRWYAPLLIPPAFTLVLLSLLKIFLSPVYSPNRFWLGVAFGVPAGFFEEIGWIGFAYPKMSRTWPPLSAAIFLGLLWSLWHLPVINFLGTAVPHGSYWLRFFLAFAAAMTAMRILICWLYAHTQSVLLAQLLHVCSTGSLVVFSPPRANAAQESLWYALYACSLWLLVALLAFTQRNFPASPDERAARS
jgi:uncharacterized protein